MITVMDINRYTINQWLATYQQVTNHILLVSLLSATVKSMRAGNYYSILFIIHGEKLSLFHTYLHSPKKHLWLAVLPAFTVFTTKTSPKDFIICLGPSIAIAKGLPKIMSYFDDLLHISLTFIQLLYSYT